MADTDKTTSNFFFFLIVISSQRSRFCDRLLLPKSRTDKQRNSFSPVSPHWRGGGGRTGEQRDWRTGRRGRPNNRHAGLFMNTTYNYYYQRGPSCNRAEQVSSYFITLFSRYMTWCYRSGSHKRIFHCRMCAEGPTCVCPGLTGSEQHRLKTSDDDHFFLCTFTQPWGWKTLYHEFFRRAVLLGLQRLSCTAGSCIFNEEKHNGQNAMDLKCRYKGGWPCVLLFSQFTQSFSHRATREPVMDHERNPNGGPEGEHRGRERGREDAHAQHPQFKVNMTRWKKIKCALFCYMTWT